MDKKILITGATGFIGRHLVNKLCTLGYKVNIISTNKKKAESLFQNDNAVKIFQWSEYQSPDKLSEITGDMNAVINLAGANVGDKRWTPEFKKEIYDSRVETTRLLTQAINLGSKKPECLISASGVGFYGFRGDEVLTENSGSGSDFLAKTCEAWENEAFKAKGNVRVVIMRTGIALDKNEGALKQLLMPFKFFAGGHLGSGKQWFSWIHIDDVIELYIFSLNNENLSGALNGTSPFPITNDYLSKEIGRILKRPSIFPVPEFILRIVAGEFAENLITGQKVIPAKALEDGFEYRFPGIKKALENILKNKL